MQPLPRSDSCVRTLVAIPVFNEVRHIERVLGRVREHATDLVVIDDGSTDGTAEALRRFDGLPVIRHARNLGYGQSLIDAFGYADARRYDWVITMDCDDQHEPAHLRDFFAEIAKGDADIISGSRYLRPVGQDDVPPPDRRRINSTITWLLNETLGLTLTDAFCGFKAHRVAAMRRLALNVPGYAFPLQLWVQVVRAGLRVRELPVRLIYNDPNRHFGGELDDPDRRLRHYLDVFERELARVGWAHARHISARPSHEAARSACGTGLAAWDRQVPPCEGCPDELPASLR